MQIVLNVAEDGNVELIQGDYELIQGECCVTELKFNFPATIRGVAIGNYTKRIEFGECKELGECVKFVDDIDGDVYELNERCTAFRKIMFQAVLSHQNIVWKTIPVALEFHESVNAEGNAAIQAQILTLAKITQEWKNEITATKKAWESFIKSNALRMIHKAGDIPTADASSLGDTIFYLGANTDTPPLLTYGHYYKCNYINGVYEWTDLTQDPNLADVANGIREINKNRTLHIWQGTADELENEVPQEQVGYIAEDITAEEFLDEYISETSAVIQNAKNSETAEMANSLQMGVVSMATNLITRPITKTGLYIIGYYTQNLFGDGETYYQTVLCVHDLKKEFTAICHDETFSIKYKPVNSGGSGYIEGEGVSRISLTCFIPVGINLLI